MIPEEAKSEIRKRKEAGATWTALAKWITEEFGIDLHRTTIQRWYDKEVYSDFDGVLIEKDTPDERIKLDKKVATHKAEAAFYKKLYEQAVKDSTKKEIIVDAIKNNAPAFSSVKISHVSKRSKGTTAQVVVAPLSDLHVGDNVDLEQMAGLNQYDIDIFNKRLYGWTTQLLNLVELRRNVAPVNELIVPMLGDMISGDIHEELARTNIDHCMGQMIRGANLISQALMALAPHFKKITVPCVVGNHGRMTRKPPMKDKYMDWDYMLYQWVASMCSNQKNISFQISKSFVDSFEVFDKTILIMHGDSVSGAGGATAIMRVITNMRSVFQFTDTISNEVSGVKLPNKFDSVMMGHFHRIDEYDIGTGEIFICGTMKGVDEFAVQRLAVASKPKQIATYWHPIYGCVGKEVIYLNRYDKDKINFVDNVPDIWNTMGATHT